ncbi:Rv0361 family membrane protein [Mycobacterium sp. URHB0021]|jgi:hypothetical protein
MAPFLGALVIIVLVIIGVGLFSVFRGDGLSEEQRVGRAAVGQNDALQRENYADFRAYTCRAQQANEGEVLGRQRRSVGERGHRSVEDVTNVMIDGDKATAIVMYQFDKVPDTSSGSEIAFAREDGAWKVCTKSP